MNRQAALSPKSLLQLSRLLRAGALIAVTLAFREVFEQRAGSLIGIGFAMWAVLELGTCRLRKWAEDQSRHLERN